MNQILNGIKDTEINLNSYSNDNNVNNANIKNLKKIFFISIIICIISIIIYFSFKNYLNSKEEISKDLISNFNISTLYSNDNNYSTSVLSTEDLDNKEPFVIGLIQIDKINLTYPILSTTTDDLLKISPCRFYGPFPNEIGNLCIAGHNYTDNKHFGKIYLLENNDIIKIYDLNGNYVDYSIYEKQEVKADDLSCINQDTNNQRIVTLITCNNIKGNRIIVKAKEVL